MNDVSRETLPPEIAERFRGKDVRTDIWLIGDAEAVQKVRRIIHDLFQQTDLEKGGRLGGYIGPLVIGEPTRTHRVMEAFERAVKGALDRCDGCRRGWPIGKNMMPGIHVPPLSYFRRMTECDNPAILRDLIEVWRSLDGRD